MNTYCEEACEIGKKINSTGHWAYFVGGCVRDLYMNRTPKDYDIVTSMLPGDIQKLFPDNKPVGAKFGVILVKTPSGFLVEVATCREDGAYTDNRRPEEVKFTSDVLDDLTRRDFTMNAMVYAPWTDAPFVRDPFHGAEDIKLRQIRTVGPAEQRFEEDALRMMRAARFAAQLRFEIHSDTVDGMRQCKHLIRNISKERICEELFKILTSGRAAEGIIWLEDTGLLPEISPTMAWVPMRTLGLLSRLKAGCSPSLGMSLLLFWVGDALTQSHILRQFKLSNEEIEHCEANFQCGMLNTFAEWEPSAKVRRARRKTFKEELECFQIIDQELGRNEYPSVAAAVQALPENLTPPLFLSGDDLIAMGYTPSPKFKLALLDLETAQLNGVVTNRDQAEQLVRRRCEIPLRPC